MDAVAEEDWEDGGPEFIVPVNGKPVVKSLGGKTKLLPLLLPRFPGAIKSGRSYFEPFVGGGALFFALRRMGKIEHAFLSDTNADLICFYQVLQKNTDALVRCARAMVHTEDNYYLVRAMDSSTLDPVTRAARFLFLNKTSFNGLWRVNSKGLMNAPWGHYKNPTIVDESGLEAASRLLGIASIGLRSFEETLPYAMTGDWVYCDPPYFPASKTANFTGYGVGGFGESAQERLESMASNLAKRGVTVVLSNADVPDARALYEPSRWSITEIQAARAINSDGQKRGKVGELIIQNRRA